MERAHLDGPDIIGRDARSRVSVLIRPEYPQQLRSPMKGRKKGMKDGG